MPEGQQGPEALTAARQQKCLDQILATTYNMTETKHNENPSLMNSWIVCSLKVYETRRFARRSLHDTQINGRQRLCKCCHTSVV